jgi:hypothetical protein
VLAKRSIDPQAMTNATVNGTAVDTNGFTRGMVVFDAAPGAATTASCTVQESPDNIVAYVAVAGGTLATVLASTTHIQTLSVDLSKRLRWLRLSVVGTGAAGAMAGIILLFNPRYSAVAQDDADILV